jgi:hypothetical protein
MKTAQFGTKSRAIQKLCERISQRLDERAIAWDRRRYAEILGRDISFPEDPPTSRKTRGGGARPALQPTEAEL